MRILVADRWIEGPPDSHRPEAGYRIEVRALRNLEPIDDMYFVRPRSLRLVWNYLRQIGPRAVLRKVASRTGERLRNHKLVSCGIGRVLEGPEGGAHPRGEWVVFLAPVAPACTERLVLDEALIHPLDDAAAERITRGGALLYDAACPDESPWWDTLRGWMPDSGALLAPFAVRMALKEATRLLLGTDWTGARVLALDPASLPSEASEGAVAERVARDGRKSAVLLGYGNYAKVVALPNMRKHVDVTRIHEIDPTQIPFASPGDVVWDTAPHTRSPQRYDAHLIAGYHHTHAPLACEALRAGATAVVEKPIATTRRQLAELLEAMDASKAPLFACFQRRYLSLNPLALEDLGIEERGDAAVNYHCVVYEVPMPEQHWYRWPNSRSRLVSNGSHWIDHFLWLNGYAEVRDYDLASAPDGTLNVSVTLENDAFFSMVLTDQGSPRIGVQDHTELRANGVTVKMINGSRYEAEDCERVLRRKRVAPQQAYEQMYRSIAQKIADGAPGDSRRSVARSTQLILQLEERLERLQRGPETPALRPSIAAQSEALPVRRPLRIAG